MCNSCLSTDGREWARVDAVKAGDKLIADGGFTCLVENEVCEVFADSDGHLYVLCRGAEEDEISLVTIDMPKYDRHYLDGQLGDDATHYVGFWPA